MTQPQKNTALAFAIVAALISLPLTWMTIRATPQIQGGLGDLGELFGAMLGEMTVNVTGLSGHLTFPFKTPIWLIVAVAIAANVLQLMRNSKVFAIPRFAEWVAALVAIAWIGLAVTLALFSGKATIGVGSLLGLASAVIPILCLAIPSSKKPESDSDSDGSGD